MAAMCLAKTLRFFLDWSNAFSISLGKFRGKTDSQCHNACAPESSFLMASLYEAQDMLHKETQR